MKKFFFIILLLIILAGGGWFCFQALVIVPGDRIIVVYDETEGRIIGQHGEGIVPVYLKLIPGRITLHSFGNTGSLTEELSSPLPLLAELESSLYSVRSTFSLNYKVSAESFIINDAMLKEKDAALAAVVRDVVKGSFSFTIAEKTRDVYDYAVIAGDWPKHKEFFFATLSDRLSRKGIELVSIEQCAPLVAPTNAIYESGLAYYEQLQTLQKQYGLENEVLKGELLGDSLELDTYCRKLERVSLLIEKNPLLLQYMYIEKLGDIVTLILPSSMNGFPFGLDRTQNEKKDVIKDNPESGAQSSVSPSGQ